jgi:hypothetical protein
MVEEMGERSWSEGSESVRYNIGGGGAHHKTDSGHSLEGPDSFPTSNSTLYHPSQPLDTDR